MHPPIGAHFCGAVATLIRLSLTNVKWIVRQFFPDGMTNTLLPAKWGNRNDQAGSVG
jgi:hypothetical protein